VERRVWRRILDAAAADALVSKCRDRGITEGVLGSCTCADLMEELEVSEEAASALHLDDAAWDASVWPLLERMSESGIPPRAVAEARAAMAALPKTVAQLERCPPQALKDARVPLAVRVWLHGRASALLEDGGGRAARGAAAAIPTHGGPVALPPGDAERQDGNSEPAGGPVAARTRPPTPSEPGAVLLPTGGAPPSVARPMAKRPLPFSERGRCGPGAELLLGGAASAFAPRR
jgi:hypothetical protein